MHVHSSPLSLAARLHQGCTNGSHFINNGWTFSGQTSYMWEGQAPATKSTTEAHLQVGQVITAELPTPDRRKTAGIP